MPLRAFAAGVNLRKSAAFSRFLGRLRRSNSANPTFLFALSKRTTTLSAYVADGPARFTGQDGRLGDKNVGQRG